MDDLQEPPDVLDVRVAEGEVVVAPVHPLAEALEPRVSSSDDWTTTSRHLRANSSSPYSSISRFEFRPSCALDADLDPEPLAVEAVLVALVEAAQRLVALEDVLQRPAPRGVDAERLVRRDRAVDERPLRPAAVPLAKLLEGPLALPELEDLQLRARMIGLVR